jgi:hypothetical protein
MGNKLKERIIMDYCKDYEKCYWREIWGKMDGGGKVFDCRCNIDDETCEALRVFLKDKYKFVTITTEIPNEDGTYRKVSTFDFNSNVD